MRAECRRQRREERFATLATDEDGGLERIGPHLDEALNKLGEADRNAVILRFLEEKSLREVGEVLGISEDAARMRVNRAVTKLQASFGKAGVVVSSAVLLSALSSASAVEVPSGMVSSVIATIGKGSGVAAATMPLVKETLKAMALVKIKGASAVAAIIVALGVMIAIVTNISAEKKLMLREVWQVQGRSAYSVLSTNGTVTSSDTNDFSITVDKCKWRMLVRYVGDVPSTGTQISDDGTNYIVFVRGASGTCLQGRQLTRYEDTVNVYNSGSAYPQHHALAVWSLFGGGCVMRAPAGDIGNVFGLPPRLIYCYERFDDPKKNSFGLSRVHIFAKVWPKGTHTNINVLVAELEVLESEHKGGYAIPRRAEFRQVHQRPGEQTSKVLAIYRLSNISLQKAPPVSLWPPITRPTLIADYRHAGESFEYVSSKWTTPAEAIQLYREGNVRYHGPQ